MDRFFRLSLSLLSAIILLGFSACSRTFPDVGRQLSSPTAITPIETDSIESPTESLPKPSGDDQPLETLETPIPTQADPLQSERSPYPPSQLIVGVLFDWSSRERRAAGSDNWPVTWAADGHQYSAWGDGGGFGGNNLFGRDSLGVARIEGDLDGYRGVNLWGGFRGENPAQFEGKSYGVLSIGDTLYMWVSPGTMEENYQEARLAFSKDYGQSWEQVDWAFTRADGIVLPTFLQFGEGYRDSRDQYVYNYAIRLKDDLELQIQRPGQIDLFRAPQDRLLDRESYEFFAGLDSEGNPTWTEDLLGRQPVFEDPNGVGWTVSVTYNSGLQRYLLATEHEQSFSGNLGLFEAPQPWGPWATVGYYQNWGSLGRNFFWNFSNKWTSEDGKQFALIFTGVNENDAWNLIRGRFVVEDELSSLAPYPPSTHILDVTFDWETHQRFAPGSDNWPVTWADDDHQYTSWGDGDGFINSPGFGRVSLGFARIEGSRQEFRGVNLWGGNGRGLLGARFGGKSYGILSIDGTLYMWRCGAASDASAYDFQQLYSSADHGQAWDFTGVEFDAGTFPGEDRGFFCPAYLQFGRDYAGARDEYVYVYAPEIQTEEWEVHKPGQISLLRVPKGSIADMAAYEYFAGLNPNGEPAWTADLIGRKPVFEDETNGVMRTSVTFNSGLNRYLLITEHTQRSGGNIGIYDAPEPWGPWTTVLFQNSFGLPIIKPNSFYWNFSNKWQSEDGRDFVLVFTGKNENDSLNLVEGRFILPDP
jgi:hypothetical protein